MEQTCGTCYLVATPIGNLEDITLRALRILKEADLIAAEDTRHSRGLLTHFDIHTPLTSYHEFNKFEKAEALLAELKQGKNIAVITDAGTPGISDPGEVLACRCHDEGIPVVAVPGPAACIAAVTTAGLPCRRFAFEAFLPREKKDRLPVLEELKKETRTIVLYEAPHHLKKTLAQLTETLGSGRRAAICRELTKVHEETWRTTLGDALARYETEEPRGEYVLVIEGRSMEEAAQEAAANWASLTTEEHLNHYLEQGMDKKEAMRAVAKDRGVSKREIYQEITRG